MNDLHAVRTNALKSVSFLRRFLNNVSAVFKDVDSFPEKTLLHERVLAFVWRTFGFGFKKQTEFWDSATTIQQRVSISV